MVGLIDRTGHRFGRLLVLSRAPNKSGGAAWLCVCDCGNHSEVRGCALVTGGTKSCGCLNTENRKTNRLSHGETPLGGRPPAEYQAWLGMKRRCYNPNSQDFKHYGARGIIVCAKWRSDYAAFVQDMGRRPSRKHSIDRIDVNGNYEPENCRWATSEQQSLNTRRKRLSAAAVWIIRAAAKDGMSRPFIREQFGISKGYLNRVIRGTAWGVPRARRIAL